MAPAMAAVGGGGEVIRETVRHRGGNNGGQWTAAIMAANGTAAIMAANGTAPTITAATAIGRRDDGGGRDGRDRGGRDGRDRNWGRNDGGNNQWANNNNNNWANDASARRSRL